MRQKSGSITYLSLFPLLLPLFLLADCSEGARESTTPNLATYARGAMADFTVFEKRIPVPDTAFKDVTGKERHLSDFRGKVVLVNLWATWCGPCLVELPSLSRLHEKLDAVDFSLVLISIDRGEIAPVEAFLTRLELAHLPLYHDPKNRLNRALSPPGLPATYLIDQEGYLVGFLDGPAEWDSVAAEELIRALISGR